MFLTNETLQAICRTFMHSLWQGVIAAAIAGIILWATRHSSARKRYNLLGFLLLICLLTSGITFYTELGDSASAMAGITGTDIDTSSAVLPARPGEQVMGFINAHANWFMLAWAIIFLIKCFRLAGGFYYLHRIRRVNTHPVAVAWEETLLKLSKALGIQKKIRFLESGIVKTPLTIGFFKPLIFFPLGLLAQLPADQVETILLHELAHIRRKDYLVNMLQSFTEIIFFFNPAFLWISTCLREEREACCDDIVVAHTPHKATYLHALVAFEGQTGTILQMGLGNTRNHLLHRVKRMLTRENKKLSLMEKITITFGLIAITAFSFMPEKEAAARIKPAEVINFHLMELVYPPVQDTSQIINKIKSVDRSDATGKKIPLKASKDKWKTGPEKVAKLQGDVWVADSAKGDSWKTEPVPAPKKVKIISTDSVVFKKLKMRSTDTVTFSKPMYKKIKMASADTAAYNKLIQRKIKSALTDPKPTPNPAFKKKEISSTDTVRFIKPVLKSTYNIKLKQDRNVQITKPFAKMIEEERLKAKKTKRDAGGSLFFEDVLPKSLDAKLLYRRANKSLIPDC